MDDDDEFSGKIDIGKKIKKRKENMVCVKKGQLEN